MDTGDVSPYIEQQTYESKDFPGVVHSAGKSKDTFEARIPPDLPQHSAAHEENEVIWIDAFNAFTDPISHMLLQGDELKSVYGRYDVAFAFLRQKFQTIFYRPTTKDGEYFGIYVSTNHPTDWADIYSEVIRLARKHDVPVIDLETHLSP